MKLPVTKKHCPWLNEHVIYLTRSGSQAYGTSLPSSDLDLRGVAIPPKAYLLGFLKRFEQATFKEPDAVVYGLRKFVSLAADANPSVLELLYTDPEDHLVVTPLGERLLEARDLFLSKKARYSFVGYAMSQLKRIKTHRRWLLNPPQGQPKRADFGLPERAALSKEHLGAVEALVKAKLDTWEVDWEVLESTQRIAFRAELERILSEMALGQEGERFASAARYLGLDDNFIDLLMRERRYREAKRNWKQYQEWKRKRNPDRAALEARYGYDAKHAMHLVRLCRMGREILEEGKVIVRRPDAEELLSIRAGAWSYDQLVEWAEAQEVVMADLYQSSQAVPKEPDRKSLDRLCVSLMEEALRAPR